MPILNIEDSTDISPEDVDAVTILIVFRDDGFNLRLIISSMNT